jgi:UDP-N-acetylglucosamine 2-epimerase (non-hydrolysing)
MNREIFFIIGTSAEWYKTESCIRKCDNSILLFTGQQRGAWESALSNDLECKILVPANFTGLRKNLRVPKWMTLVLKNTILILGKSKKSGRNPVVVVQGDTLSAFVGTLASLALGIPVYHIEAGLRSGNLFHPFPEEIIRRFIDSNSKVLFAPDAISMKNLTRHRGVKVNTLGNTFLDTLPTIKEPRKSSRNRLFFLISLHRQELLFSRRKLLKTLEALSEIRPGYERHIVLDGQFKSKFPEIESWLKERSFLVHDKLPRRDFLELASNAEFIITDSGGTQEEMAIFGIPTLLHRKTSERSDGIGRNIQISGLKIRNLYIFSECYSKYIVTRGTPSTSPSDMIVRYLNNET